MGVVSKLTLTNMYKTLILALALAAPALATLPLILTTATAAGVTTATTTLLAAPAVTGLLGAAVLVKGIGLGLLLREAGKKKGMLAVDPNPLDSNHLSPSSANLNPPNASEGSSVMLPPVSCPLMILMKSSWPHSLEPLLPMLMLPATLSTTWLPLRMARTLALSRNAN